MHAQLHTAGQTTTRLITRPTDPAPLRSAPYEMRAAWSERYVRWFMSQMPTSLTLPADIEPTHLY